MLRTTTFALVCATLALSSVFVTGCVGETDNPRTDEWYDEETARCYTEDEAGNAVEVRCDGGLETFNLPPNPCGTSDECTHITQP